MVSEVLALLLDLWRWKWPALPFMQTETRTQMFKELAA